jgi:hypothetical protein
VVRKLNQRKDLSRPNAIIKIKGTRLVDFFRPLTDDDKWDGVKGERGNFGKWSRIELRSSGPRVVKGHVLLNIEKELFKK